jgi:hypothetical protein
VSVHCCELGSEKPQALKGAAACRACPCSVHECIVHAHHVHMVVGWEHALRSECVNVDTCIMYLQVGGQCYCMEDMKARLLRHRAGGRCSDPRIHFALSLGAMCVYVYVQNMYLNTSVCVCVCVCVCVYDTAEPCQKHVLRTFQHTCVLFQ